MDDRLAQAKVVARIPSAHDDHTPAAQAAAILAALEQFLRDTAHPPARPPASRAGAWLRAGRREALRGELATRRSWGQATRGE
ncbi:MAG: hypothetical protein ABSG64_12955 [Solirubrobacteraceae bacterium]